MKDQHLAVGLMIGQAILFAVETAMIHHIGSRGSAMQLALLRSGGGLTLVGLLAWNTGWSVMKTNQLPLTAAPRICVGLIPLGPDVLVRPFAVR